MRSKELGTASDRGIGSTSPAEPFFEGFTNPCLFRNPARSGDPRRLFKGTLVGLREVVSPVPRRPFLNVRLPFPYILRAICDACSRLKDRSTKLPRRSISSSCFSTPPPPCGPIKCSKVDDTFPVPCSEKDLLPLLQGVGVGPTSGADLDGVLCGGREGTVEAEDLHAVLLLEANLVQPLKELPQGLTQPNIV